MREGAWLLVHTLGMPTKQSAQCLDINHDHPLVGPSREAGVNTGTTYLAK
jgi:hypothetical protein